ncbi:MAG: hypothetical protein K6B52_09230 [Clostridiales bacterium]|nr:hypothetical protein [Clostridiales bacterium]
MRALFYRITGLLFSLLFAITGVNESVIGFTDGTPIKAKDRNYSFSEDGRLLIGAYYADPDKLEEAKQAGLEFFITDGVNEKMLNECERLGLGVIAGGYNLPRGYGNLSDSVRDRWVDFDISEYKNHPALWGDDLIDEPGADSFVSISKALEAYYSKTRGKIGLVNLFPMYATGEQLNEESGLTFLQKLMLYPAGIDDSADMFKRYLSDYINKIDTDYICVDIYPMHERAGKNGELTKITSPTWVRSLDILAQACRDTNRSLWIITQAAGLTSEGVPGKENPRWCDEISDVSQQAYASLAFGAGAIIHAEYAARGWWDKGSHMIDENGNTTDTYDAVKAVNMDLKAFALEYGKYSYSSSFLVNGSKAAGFSGGRLAVQKNGDVIDILSKNALLVGCFDGEEGKAYVVANMEELEKNVTASAVCKVPSGKTLTLYQGGETKEYSGGKTLRLSLAPGEGVFFTVR